MINTNFRQGMFKKYDELIIIDPCNSNNWKIVLLCENYGITRDVKVITFYEDGCCSTKVKTIDTHFRDIFFDIYKIIERYWYDTTRICT